MPLKRLLCCVGLGLAVACSSSTAPPAPDALVSASQVASPAAPQAHVVTAGGGSVYVDGSIATPYWCYGFDATAIRWSGEFLVTLYAGPSSEGCVAVGGWWDYRITVPQVPPGTWRVRVRHVFPPSTGGENVFEGSVRVP